MLIAARPLLMLLLVLTVVYVCLWLYFRSRKRDRLIDEWQGEPGRDLEMFVRAALARTEKTLRIRLFVAVYIVPLSLIALLIYVTNFM